eukprot:5804715-Amphidinium_carterae.1
MRTNTMLKGAGAVIKPLFKRRMCKKPKTDRVCMYMLAATSTLSWILMVFNVQVHIATASEMEAYDNI